MKGNPFDFFVQFHLTERCNLACRHCYQSGIVSEMNYEEVCGAIADAKTTIEGWARDYEMDVSPSLHFTGGEPLLQLGGCRPYLRGIRSGGWLLAETTAADPSLRAGLRPRAGSSSTGSTILAGPAGALGPERASAADFEDIP